MNGFMVALRHSMDDIPLRLFATRDEATQFASTVKEGDDDEACRIISSDASTPISVAIYEFANGVLVKCDVAKTLDDEPAAA